MKKFLTMLGIVLAVGLSFLFASGFYFYKKFGPAMAQVDVYLIDDFLAKHPASEHVKDTLKRLRNDLHQPRTVAAELVATTALGVLTLPGAVTDEQEAMLEEAAKLVEDEKVAIPDVKSFTNKYADLLPKKPAVPGRN